MIVFGGINELFRPLDNIIRKLDLSNFKWDIVANYKYDRSSHTACFQDKTILLFAGSDSSNKNYNDL